MWRSSSLPALAMSWASQEEKVFELIQRIKNFVYTRRLRIKEFFLDFDPLRTGRCTRPQMARALSNVGTMGLTLEETDLLADFFEEHGPGAQKPQTINYYKLCSLIDEVFIEREGAPEASPSSPGRSTMSTFRPASYKEGDEVNMLLHRLATLCQTRGVHLKASFQDYTSSPSPTPSRTSPKGGGKCTVGQFVKAFPFAKDFSEKDISMLIDRYRTKTGDVHFQALHNDVSEVMSNDPQPFPRSDLFLRPDESDWSHRDLSVVRKLQAKAVEKRVRLFELFQDFDPLRKGFCTVGQVRTVLTLANLAKDINKDDFDQLVQSYSREDGLFGYAWFCEQIDEAFTTKHLEQAPLATVSMPDSTVTSPARRNYIRLDQLTQNRVAEVEDCLRAKIRVRRILIKPMFQDLDRSHRGFISKSQFARAMGTCGLALSETEIALLSTVYCTLGNHVDFNYVDFCKRVDPMDDDVQLAAEQMRQPYEAFVPSMYFDDTGKVVAAA